RAGRGAPAVGAAGTAGTRPAPAAEAHAGPRPAAGAAPATAASEAARAGRAAEAAAAGRPEASRLDRRRASWAGPTGRRSLGRPGNPIPAGEAEAAADGDCASAATPSAAAVVGTAVADREGARVPARTSPSAWSRSTHLPSS